MIKKSDISPSQVGLFPVQTQKNPGQLQVLKVCWSPNPLLHLREQIDPSLAPFVQPDITAF